jgi:hypothetical protein
MTDINKAADVKPEVTQWRYVGDGKPEKPFPKARVTIVKRAKNDRHN